MDTDKVIGRIGWLDLTVHDAPGIRDFYAAVVGWGVAPVDMDGYDDYSMTVGDEPVAGVCHPRGVNADLPPCWLAYVNVEDLDRAMQACTERGGTVLGEVRGGEEYGRFCIIRDPAGAHLALFQHPAG